jgi:hypothetical protein
MRNYDESQPIEEFDPVRFDLASGDLVKVSLGLFWSKVSESDRRLGYRPYQYLAIRVYSNEDSQPRRIQQIHEFYGGKDFERPHCFKIWKWVLGHAESRERLNHENTDDFLALLESVIDKIQAADEDMLEHLEHLPSLTIPDAFDRFDDSIFTDQSDSEQS